LIEDHIGQAYPTTPAKLQHFPTAIPASDSEDVSKINHLRIEQLLSQMPGTHLSYLLGRFGG
jgi:hypothetical protein